MSTDRILQLLFVLAAIAALLFAALLEAAARWVAVTGLFVFMLLVLGALGRSAILRFQRSLIATINSAQDNLKTDLNQRFEQFSERLSIVEAAMIKVDKDQTRYASDESHASHYNYSAVRYGIGYDLLRVECIINPDGSAEIIRTVTVTAHAELREIDVFLLVPEDPPEERLWHLEAVRVRSHTPNRHISLTEGPGTSGKSSALLTLAPELRSGQTMQYELTQKVPSGLFAIDWSPERLAAERKTPYDYFGWHINRPTKLLSLSVHFPNGYGRPLDYGREVRYASASSFPSTRVQTEEQKRLETCSITEQGGRYVLSLDVSYPMTGLLYMISWRPTPRESPRDSVISYEAQVTQETGIPIALSRRLLTTLPRCGPFNTNEELKGVFVDARINAWRNRVPEERTAASRVQALIHYLHDRRDQKGRNALSLFLEVVADELDPADACKSELESLAEELRDL